LPTTSQLRRNHAQGTALTHRTRSAHLPKQLAGIIIIGCLAGDRSRSPPAFVAQKTCSGPSFLALALKAVAIVASLRIRLHLSTVIPARTTISEMCATCLIPASPSSPALGNNQHTPVAAIETRYQSKTARQGPLWTTAAVSAFPHHSFPLFDEDREDSVIVQIKTRMSHTWTHPSASAGAVSFPAICAL
jgi:hypothetical protein